MYYEIAALDETSPDAYACAIRSPSGARRTGSAPFQILNLCSPRVSRQCLPLAYEIEDSVYITVLVFLQVLV